MKPRIRKSEWFAAGRNVIYRWECQGGSTVGYGVEPVHAWQNWLAMCAAKRAAEAAQIHQGGNPPLQLIDFSPHMGRTGLNSDVERYRAMGMM